MWHRRRWRWLTAAVALLVVSALPAAAQEYRGNLFIQVQDETGKPMAGAKVAVSGTDYERSATTDADGKVRFIKLEPGRYQLKASAETYSTLILENIEINTFANTALTVKMTPTAETTEDMVVTAETPVLDQRKTGTSTLLSQTELSQIPTSRDPWAVLSTVPGITTDRVNVGGNESGQQSNFVGKGDDGSNTTWVMDGVEFTDVGAAGSSPTYFDFNTFEELGFVTGGADVDQQTGGARFNFTTKQGTNDIGGNIRLWYTEKGLQSDIKTLSQPANAASDPLPANSINEVFEKNFNIGGPMVKDHAWFWFGFNQNDIDNQIATQSDKTKLTNTTIKLHGQAAYKFNWKAFYTNGNKTKDGRGAAITRPLETTWNQKGPTPIYTAYGSYLINPDWELSAQYGHVDGKFSLTPKGGLDAQIINDANNVWSGSFVLYDTVRPQDQAIVRGVNFFKTGDWEHELKYGYRYKKSTVESLSKWSNSDFFVYSGAYIYLYRERDFSVDLKHQNLWIGDTVTKGNWALTGGLSHSRQEGKNDATNIPGVGICPTCLPGLNYAGADAPFEWKDTNPRVGVTYTFDTAKRILVRGNFSRYVDGLGAVDVQYDNPAAGYIYITQYWTDLNTDGQVQPGEFSTDCDDAVNGSIDPCDPNGFFDKIDPNYKAPRVDELIGGVEFEIAKDFTVAGNLIWRTRDRDRWYEGNLDGRPVASHGPLYDMNVYNATGQLVPLAASDYECSTLLTGMFPGGASYSEPICFQNASGLAKNPAGVADFLTNRPGYEQEYKGLELTATKRLSNKWMLRGYLSYGDWTQKFSGTSGISDPTNFQGGTTAQSGDISVPSVGSGTKDGIWLGTSRWQVNVNALYQLPRGMTISGNIYGREGYGIPYIDRNTPKDVQIGKITDYRYDDLWTLDLAFGKTINLRGGTLELRAELFNALNENTVLSRRVRADLGNVNAITENLSPRIFRLGASMNF